MFVVIEIQKNGNQVATIVNSYENRNDAENRYHTILGAAAVSTVECHAATMLTDKGAIIKSEYYEHEFAS